MLLDGDGPGKKMANELTSGLYAGEKEKVLSVTDFVDFDLAEIEDLFPPRFLADEIDRMERESDVRLSDAVRVGEPFVRQVEAWATSQRVSLRPHWKVELAKRVKTRALIVGHRGFDNDVLDKWTVLFKAFAGNGA